MPARHEIPSLRRPAVWGFLAALLAWACLTASAWSQPGADTIGQLASAGVICHAGSDPADDAPAEPLPSHRDCALCPLCVAVAAPVAILSPKVAVLPPPKVADWLAAPARAPPIVVARHRAPAQPRAPPVSV